MKNKNWFWGLFFLLAAVFVVAGQIGFFGHFGLFTIAASVLLLGILINSSAERNYFGIFVSIALLYWVYEEPLHLVDISVWHLFLAALLASIGCSILFGHRPPHMPYMEGRCAQTFENVDDNNPCAKVSFGASSKYLHGTCIRNGQFYASFGAMEVYFDQAQLSPEGAEIYLDCSFGAIKLFVPRTWQVRSNVKAGLGSVEDDNRPIPPAPDAPMLTLTGNVQFGAVEIHYI